MNKQIRTIGGIIMTYVSATVSITNPTWNGLGLNPGLCNDRMTTNSLRQVEMRSQMIPLWTNDPFVDTSKHHLVNTSNGLYETG
jgi:hypothetical protein